jgi:Tfp pilus assembly protein PilX
MKGETMKTFFDQGKKEEGSVLIVALLILVLLTLMGISATTTTNIEMQVAGNEKFHKMVFYAAEAGIEVGRAALNDLKVADSGSWDNLLQGNQLVGQVEGDTTLDDVIDAVGGRAVGPASFTLEVMDNEDLDGSDDVDTDNIVILISTGSYRNAQVQIEAIVRYVGGGDEYAQEHYDAASTGEAAREGTAVVNNKRW